MNVFRWHPSVYDSYKIDLEYGTYTEFASQSFANMYVISPSHVHLQP